MTRRRAFGIALVLLPFVGLGLVFAMSAYSGCEIQDRPFAFLGDDCYRHGIRWNSIAAPLGTLSIAWIIVGPVIWIAFLAVEKCFQLAKRMRDRNA